jgi:hypothetical protein
MTYRFQWILDDIRNGLELPARWPEDDETEDDETEDDETEETDEDEIANFAILPGKKGTFA